MAWDRAASGRYMGIGRDPALRSVGRGLTKKIWPSHLLQLVDHRTSPAYLGTPGYTNPMAYLVHLNFWCIPMHAL